LSKSLPLFLLAVIVAAATWFWFHRGERTPPSAVAKATPAEPAAPPNRAPPPPQAAPEPAPAPAHPPPPQPRARKITLADIVQPPPDAPVRDVVAKLADAANQGVPQAACRLGYELLRCARASRGLLALEKAQKAATAGPKDTREAQAAAREAMQIAQTLARDQQACRDVTDAETSDAWRYVYIGAANGSVAAMTRFVRDPGIPGTPGSSDYAEAWAAYARDAPQFLAEAIRAGDVRALYQGYVSALTGQSAGGAGVFARNPEKAIAYAVALRGLRDPAAEQEIAQQVRTLIDQVGPARADAARQQGEKMRTDFFANAAQLSGAQDRAIDAAECWK
jgi:hypothetical protein